MELLIDKPNMPSHGDKVDVMLENSILYNIVVNHFDIFSGNEASLFTCGNNAFLIH